MITPEFILESVVIAIVLTSYTSYVNLRQRKKMKEQLGEKCKDSVKFYFKHPYLSILTNFGIFLIITIIIKLLHDVIFD